MRERFDHAGAVAAVMTGRNMADVGVQFGVSREAIRQAVRRAGAVPPTGKDAPVRDWTDNILQMAHDGASDAAISKALHVSYTKVQRIRRAASVSQCGKRERLSLGLAEHLNSGGSLSGFARLRGVHSQTVFEIARRLGLRSQHLSFSARSA